MAVFRIREVKFIETEGGHVKLKPLREYEREASDAASVIAEVSHFFELELSSPKALDRFRKLAILALAGQKKDFASHPL